MRGDISYLDEDEFLLGLSELTLNQERFSQFDVQRLAKDATDKRVVNNSRLLKRSYVVADMLMQKWGYVLNQLNGVYELIIF